MKQDNKKHDTPEELANLVKYTRRKLMAFVESQLSCTDNPTPEQQALAAGILTAADSLKTVAALMKTL
jgi:hypothetical protein